MEAKEDFNKLPQIANEATAEQCYNMSMKIHEPAPKA